MFLPRRRVLAELPHTTTLAFQTGHPLEGSGPGLQLGVLKRHWLGHPPEARHRSSERHRSGGLPSRVGVLRHHTRGTETQCLSSAPIEWWKGGRVGLGLFPDHSPSNFRCSLQRGRQLWDVGCGRSHQVGRFFVWFPSSRRYCEVSLS